MERNRALSGKSAPQTTTETTGKKVPTAPKLIECQGCGDDFDPAAKKQRGRKLYGVCVECQADSTVRYTGVMVWGGKNAGEVQINTDPALTDYMRGASMQTSSAPTIVTSKAHRTRKVVTGLENRRHGDST